MESLKNYLLVREIEKILSDCVFTSWVNTEIDSKKAVKNLTSFFKENNFSIDKHELEDAVDYGYNYEENSEGYQYTNYYETEAAFRIYEILKS